MGLELSFDKYIGDEGIPKEVLEWASRITYLWYISFKHFSKCFSILSDSACPLKYFFRYSFISNILMGLELSFDKYIGDEGIQIPHCNHCGAK